MNRVANSRRPSAFSDGNANGTRLSTCWARETYCERFEGTEPSTAEADGTVFTTRAASRYRYPYFKWGLDDEAGVCRSGRCRVPGRDRRLGAAGGDHDRADRTIDDPFGPADGKTAGGAGDQSAARR